ncbi:Hypothetical Protein FCC1311_110482 [Hondaea fermentalgiana]|uniref:Uncharacterized protein n=1 Tax=Hondaea fermentalgiana TaxID=2315210 RepID=A0A2R5GVF2_9STRA|nr:Hypothetical Protein FCC1311_110482 [Hondaea fermentalgiana]|eukprot:GBG34826.1 Hypothetical Protein FCC1311_110482 [Hondaea fermentalgiana]
MNATVTTMDSEWSASASRAVRMIPITPRPTVTEEAFPGAVENQDAKVLKYATYGGGGAFLTASVFAIAMLVYRRRWQRDKEFIEQGKLYNLEREVHYDPNTEYNLVTRMVMSTSAAIQRERARLGEDTHAATISQLHTERQELQDQVRFAKQERQRGLLRGGMNRLSQKFRVPVRGRRQFPIDETEAPL